jgi:hypothetical protein
MGVYPSQRRWRGQAWRPPQPSWHQCDLSVSRTGTALAEYQQTDALLEPALMVSYKVDVDSVVDFRAGFSSAWDPLWQDFYCDWRRMHFNDGVEPPSWVIGDQVLAARAKGILFRSIDTGGTNLVLYNDALTRKDTIAVHDPRQALPKNQDSWH